MANRGTRLLQAEPEELKVSAETWRNEVGQLKEALAEKEKVLRRAVRKRHTRAVLHKQLQEEEELHQGEPMKDRSNPRRHQLHVIDEGWERELEEQQQSCNQEEEAMRLKLLREEEQSIKQLKEEQKYEENLLEKEESMKQQLLDKEERFHKLLTEVCEQWESRAQQQEELKNQLQENKVQQVFEDTILPEVRLCSSF